MKTKNQKNKEAGMFWSSVSLMLSISMLALTINMMMSEHGGNIIWLYFVGLLVSGWCLSAFLYGLRDYIRSI